MAVTKHFINPSYDWYSPEIHPDNVQLARKKGIIGWTGEHDIRGGIPQGKPIYPGFENNAHIGSPQEHKLAASALHQRARRIEAALASKKVPDHDLPIVQKELLDLQSQKDKHIKASLPQRAPAPAMAKTESGFSPLQRLRSLRAKTAQKQMI